MNRDPVLQAELDYDNRVGRYAQAPHIDSLFDGVDEADALEPEERRHLTPATRQRQPGSFHKVGTGDFKVWREDRG